MSKEKNIILQFNVNQNVTISQLLLINTSSFNKTIKVGLSIADILNEDAHKRISEIIQSGKNDETFKIDKPIAIFSSPIEVLVQKIHPQSYNVTLYKEELNKKEKSNFNALENLLLNLSTDGIIVVDRFGYIQYSNYAFSEISKYSVETLKNKLFYPLFVRSNEWSQHSGKETLCYDDLLALDGALIPVQIIRHNIKINQNEKGTVYIIKNISQLKIVENELSIRDNIIDSIFFASQQFLFSTNWEDNIHKVLEHLGKSIHASRINLIENNINSRNEICMKFNQSWTDEKFKQINLSNQRCIAYFPHHEELFFELSAGNVFYIDNDPKYNFYHHQFNIKSGILIPIFKKDQWWGFLGVDECHTCRTFKNSEIQALRQIANIIGASVYQQSVIKEIQFLKEKSEESDRLKTAFLSNIGHELRTPLNAVLGFSELLKKPSLTPEKHKEFVQHILDNSKKLLQSIDHLVNFSKLESGTIQIRPESVIIQNLLHELSIYANREIINKNKTISLSIHCDDPGANIITDKTLLIQAFDHIISNAIKFTHSGKIEIGSLFKENHYLFYVSDTGTGIEKDKLTIIFDRFRIIENETTRVNPGMRIGLPITKRILEKLKGNIWVESEIGVGTTVFFTLPLKLESETNDFKQYDFSSEPNKIYLLEENNTIYFRLYSILKLEYPNIVRINNIEEVEKEKAGLVILNSNFYTPDHIQYLQNLTQRYPKLKFVNQSFAHEKNFSPLGFASLPQNYEQLLPTIKSILK
jgi:PAS domain S-box-containing protein